MRIRYASTHPPLFLLTKLDEPPLFSATERTFIEFGTEDQRRHNGRLTTKLLTIVEYFEEKTTFFNSKLSFLNNYSYLCNRIYEKCISFWLILHKGIRHKG